MSAYDLDPEIREHLGRFWRIVENAHIDNKALLESFIVAILGAERYMILRALEEAEDVGECIEIVRRRLVNEIPTRGLIRAIDVGV